MGPVVPKRNGGRCFPEYPLTTLGMEHPVFHTVHDIRRIEGQARNAETAQRGVDRQPARRALFPGWPQRYSAHARMLLLRRERNHELHRGERQHSGLFTVVINSIPYPGKSDSCHVCLQISLNPLCSRGYLSRSEALLARGLGGDLVDSIEIRCRRSRCDMGPSLQTGFGYSSLPETPPVGSCPCGCASNQSGGLLRLGSFVRANRSKNAKRFLLDAGGSPGRSFFLTTSGEISGHHVKGKQQMGLAAFTIWGKAELDVRVGAVAIGAVATEGPFHFGQSAGR